MRTPTRRFEYALGLLCLYVGVSYGLDSMLLAIHRYALLGFDVLFVGLSVFLFREDLKFRFKFQRWMLLEWAGVFLAGGLVARGGQFLSLPMPWDLSDFSNIALLGFAGPLIEEGVFRQALWVPLLILVPKEKLVILLTSLFFAYAHFHAYFSAPEVLMYFVFYQTIYAFFLAVWIGVRRAQTESVLPPIAMHLLFNWGFYLGWVL